MMNEYKILCVGAAIFAGASFAATKALIDYNDLFKISRNSAAHRMADDFAKYPINIDQLVKSVHKTAPQPIISADASGFMPVCSIEFRPEYNSKRGVGPLKAHNLHGYAVNNGYILTVNHGFPTDEHLSQYQLRCKTATLDGKTGDSVHQIDESVKCKGDSIDARILRVKSPWGYIRSIPTKKPYEVNTPIVVKWIYMQGVLDDIGIRTNGGLVAGWGDTNTTMMDANGAPIPVTFKDTIYLNLNGKRGMSGAPAFIQDNILAGFVIASSRVNITMDGHSSGLYINNAENYPRLAEKCGIKNAF